MPDKCTFTTIIAYYPHSNIPREDIILITHMETGSKRLNSLCDDKWKIMTSEYPCCPFHFVRTVCLRNRNQSWGLFSISYVQSSREKLNKTRLAFPPQIVISSTFWVLYIGSNAHSSMKAVKMTIISHIKVIISETPILRHHTL